MFRSRIIYNVFLARFCSCSVELAIENGSKSAKLSSELVLGVRALNLESFCSLPFGGLLMDIMRVPSLSRSLS